MTAQRVKSIEHLAELAGAKMCVCTSWMGRRPAAFMINLSGSYLLWIIARGLYIYQRKWRKPKALLTEGQFKAHDEVRMRYDWTKYDPRKFVVSETFDGYVYLTNGVFVHRDKLERVYR